MKKIEKIITTLLVAIHSVRCLTLNNIGSFADASVAFDDSTGDFYVASVIQTSNALLDGNYTLMQEAETNTTYGFQASFLQVFNKPYGFSDIGVTRLQFDEKNRVFNQAQAQYFGTANDDTKPQIYAHSGVMYLTYETFGAVFNTQEFACSLGSTRKLVIQVFNQINKFQSTNCLALDKVTYAANWDPFQSMLGVMLYDKAQSKMVYRLYGMYGFSYETSRVLDSSSQSIFDTYNLKMLQSISSARDLVAVLGSANGDALFYMPYAEKSLSNSPVLFTSFGDNSKVESLSFDFGRKAVVVAGFVKDQRKVLMQSYFTGEAILNWQQSYFPMFGSPIINLMLLDESKCLAVQSSVTNQMLQTSLYNVTFYSDVFLVNEEVSLVTREQFSQFLGKLNMKFKMAAVGYTNSGSPYASLKIFKVPDPVVISIETTSTQSADTLSSTSDVVPTVTSTTSSFIVTTTTSLYGVPGVESSSLSSWNSTLLSTSATFQVVTSTISNSTTVSAHVLSSTNSVNSSTAQTVTSSVSSLGTRSTFIVLSTTLQPTLVSTSSMVSSTLSTSAEYRSSSTVIVTSASGLSSSAMVDQLVTTPIASQTEQIQSSIDATSQTVSINVSSTVLASIKSNNLQVTSGTQTSVTAALKTSTNDHGQITFGVGSQVQISQSISIEATVSTTNNIGNLGSQSAAGNMTPIYYAAGAAGAAVVGMVGAAAFFQRRKRARAYKKRVGAMNTGNYMSTTYTATQMAGATLPFNNTTARPVGGTTMFGGNTTMRTVVSDQKEMSIPGFLLMQPNLDFITDKVLGEGGFATVYAGQLLTPDAMKRAGSNKVAVKVIKPQPNATTEMIDEDQQAFIQEVSLLNFFSSNKLFVKLVGFSQNPNTIVMKFYEYGSVEDVLNGKSKSGQWSFDLMIPLFCDIVEGLSEMHKNGFVHSDIKPANIMLGRESESERFHAVISDFGITQIVSNKALLVSAFHVSKLQGASVNYAAPELLRKLTNQSNQLDEDASAQNKLKLDVYAVSIMGYEMVTRTPAWAPRRDTEVIDAALNGIRPQFPNQFMSLRHQDLRLTIVCSLIERGWSSLPQDRPSMMEMQRELMNLQ
ncbi:hypothetical protein MP228_012606 [Amoeboaphelidium protococcarum]|nr:hypothetical protein MP228_012606 [Amoeboaphelidium protococcarum]